MDLRARSEAMFRRAGFAVEYEASLAQCSHMWKHIDSLSTIQQTIAGKGREHAKSHPDHVRNVAIYTHLSVATLERMSIGFPTRNQDEWALSQLGLPISSFFSSSPDFLGITQDDVMCFVPRSMQHHISDLILCNHGMDVATCVELGRDAVGKEGAVFRLATMMSMFRWVPLSAKITYVAENDEAPDLFDSNIDCLADVTALTGQTIQNARVPAEYSSIHDWFTCEIQKLGGSPAHRNSLMQRKFRDVLSHTQIPLAPSSSAYIAQLRTSLEEACRNLLCFLTRASRPQTARELAESSRQSLHEVYEALAHGYRQGRITRRWKQHTEQEPGTWQYSATASG